MLMAFRDLGQRTPCEFRTGNFVGGGGSGGRARGPRPVSVRPEPWLYLGVTYLEDMDHRGRRCVWAHPTAGGAMIARFENVPLGAR